MSLDSTPSEPSLQAPTPAPVETAVVSASERRRLVRSARLLAMAVDFVQWVAVPFFLPGAASPINAVVDLITAIVLTRLVGWHVAFLPTFVVELIPMVDLFPTWTVAVFVATRGDKAAPTTPPAR